MYVEHPPNEDYQKKNYYQHFLVVSTSIFRPDPMLNTLFPPYLNCEEIVCNKLTDINIHSSWPCRLSHSNFFHLPNGIAFGRIHFEFTPVHLDTNDNIVVVVENDDYILNVHRTKLQWFNSLPVSMRYETNELSYFTYDI